jgi:mono/diheme cytochrome c family protein
MGLGGPRVNLLPRDAVAGTGTGGASGDPQWPAAFVHHVHAGVVLKGDTQFVAQAHFLSNWSQDDRVQRSPDEDDGVCDLPTTPEVNECYVRDGRMRVVGVDAKMLSNTYGVLGIGGSYIDASYAFSLKGMMTYAGDGERLTGAWFGPRSEGTGKLLVGGVSYQMSVASLMLAPEPFNGQAPDIVVNAGFNIGRITTAEEPFNGRVRHKYGIDVLYTPLRYVGVGGRVDRVVPASDDPDQTFHVIAPRLQFKTDWTSHEAIVLSYVKWFLGPNSHYDGLNPRSVEYTLALGRQLALSTCSECHGWDLNAFEGDETPSLVVAKAYSNEQFIRLMRTGEVAAGGKSTSGLMTDVAAYRFKVMTDEEIHALKAYLDSR